MKKLLALSAVLAFGLTACGKDNSSSSNSSSNAGSSAAPVTKKVNVGVGYTGSWNGSNQFDLTTAMVAFDANGKIEGARIDVIQVKVAANEAKNGVTIASTKGDKGLNEDGTIKTKLELGTDYGMVQFGGSIAEVDAQIEAFTKWTVGKTISELNDSTQLKDHGGEMCEYLKDGILTSSCTIVVEDFIDAIESAYALKSTTTYDVAPEFTTGVAVNANLYNPTTLDFDLGGALVVDNKVVAASVDCVAVEFAVDAEGVVSLKSGSQYQDATTGAFKSKKTLGDAYGMKKGNGQGYGTADLEWWEQAAVIESACVGKTSAEISAMVKGEGDLATATMNLSTYTGSVAKAATYAPLTQIGPKA